MSIFEYFINGLSTILGNKMRSWLTMLWIIIWVSSVVLMLWIWKWAQEWVTERIEQMWTNLLIVFPWSSNTSNVRAFFWKWWNSWELPLEDVEVLENEITDIEAFSPEYSGRKQIVYKTNNMSSTIVWAMTEYENVRNFKVNVWRFINEDDIKNATRSAVIGIWVAQTLFWDINPIWEDLRMENTILTVIWVMEEKWSSTQDDSIIVALTTAQKRIFWNNNIQSLYIKAKEWSDIQKVQSNIETVLKKEHWITNEEDVDFTVVNQAEIIWTMNEITWIFTLLLWWIASISLIVWWIWVMNIMLVSVTERTKEIWIRKAIWARNKDILYQFLTESVLLSILGWALGILLSFMIYLILSKYLTSFMIIISYNSIILSFVFSASVWIIFWILPAMKAAKLNPIDALRYE